MPCPTLWLLRQNTVDLEHIDGASSTSVAFDSITTDPRPRDIRSVFRAHQDRDGIMHAGSLLSLCMIFPLYLTMTNRSET